jgi:plasminogen activator inhibitor 1 RNA-binding protein
MHYSVDTASKFAYFADSDIEEADPDELIQKAKREKESEKIAKEKAKKEEKDKNKKSKVKEAQPAPQSQPQSIKPKEGTKVIQNAQNNKPPRLTRPKIDDQVQSKPSFAQPGELEDNSSPKQSNEQPADSSSQYDRPFRGRGGFRGGRGRGGFPRDDPGFQGFSEGNVMGESGEFRRGGFRGRGGRRGTGIHPQERHSGSRVTGIKAVEKRNGAGAHNWGSEQDELDLIDSEKLQSGIVEIHSEAANVPGDINADENIPPVGNEHEEVNEEKAAEDEMPEESNGPKDMTVEEYLAKCAGERERLQGLTNLTQKKTKKKVPVPAEGKDASFKGMVAYIKKSTAEDEESDEEEYEEGDDYEENSKRKRTLEVPFRHNRNGGGGGGGRGFRGRGRGRGAGDFRGGRGRGTGRGGSVQARDEDVQLQLTSDIDFPCL